MRHEVRNAALERISDQDEILRMAIDECWTEARKRLDAEHRKQFVLTTKDNSKAAEAIIDGIDEETFLCEKAVMGIRTLTGSYNLPNGWTVSSDKAVP